MRFLLDEARIRQLLEKLSGWERVENGIKKKFKLKNFAVALEFVNGIGKLAESMDHHPDIFIHDYKFVAITSSTHTVGGLTQMDFNLAQEIEKIWEEFYT